MSYASVSEGRTPLVLANDGFTRQGTLTPAGRPWQGAQPVHGSADTSYRRIGGFNWALSQSLSLGYDPWLDIHESGATSDKVC